MNRLLKWEFRKLRGQKSFYICTAVMIALLILSALSAKAMCHANEEFAAQYNGTGMASALGAISGCSFLLIAGIFTALFVCEDYEQQTVKNIFSKGYSRSQVYFSKFIAVFIAVTVMFILVVASAFALGSLNFGIGAAGGYAWIGTLAVQYVACMANISFSFALSGIFRKNGSSIAAVIVAPMLVNMVLGAADSFLKSEKIVLARLWVASFIQDLSAMTIDNHRFIVCLTASLLYIPLFLMIGSFFHKKLEL